jgi:hypothetical protein
LRGEKTKQKNWLHSARGFLSICCFFGLFNSKTSPKLGVDFTTEPTQKLGNSANKAPAVEAINVKEELEVTAKKAKSHS